MATTIYLTNTASDIDPGGAGEEALEARVAVRGAGLSTGTADTIASGANICLTRDTASDIEVVWYTKPLDAVTLSVTNSITFNFWMSENNMSANVQAACDIWIVSAAGADQHEITNESNSRDGVELAVTTRAAHNFTSTSLSTQTVDAGERLRIKIIGTNIGTMGGGFTFNAGWGATSGGVDGDSFVTFTETITELAVASPSLMLPNRNVAVIRR